MRWMWIDRVVELVPGQKMVAIKNVSMSEDHLHDHFPEVRDDAGNVLRPSLPVMPACFIVEGMAQTAGVLVGHAEGFKEKVVLAKVGRVELEKDATPGCTLRYTAVIRNFDKIGASTEGTVELIDPVRGTPETIGRIDLMFSHLDNNMAGTEFPEHNFVFGESFKTLLRTSGIA